MRKRNSKQFYFILILILLFCVSIGYSAINRVLNISGSSEVKQNTWNLYFDNVNVRDGSVNATKVPTIGNSGLLVDFNVMLNLHGDFYEFTIDVINNGSIDAMIDSIIKTPELTTEQKNI